MRKLIALLVLFPFLAGASFAPNPYSSLGDGQQCASVSEEDGSPSVGCPDIKVSNGTLTNNNDGTVSITTGGSPSLPLSVANGGFGQSMAQQNSTLTGTQSAFAAGLIRWAGASTLTITGITAPSESRYTEIYNTTASPVIQITNQNSGATAANRIITMSGSTQNINPGQSALLTYDTSSSRWRLLRIGNINSVSTPLSLSTSGQISITQASTVANGFLSAGDFTTFSSKVSSAGSAAQRMAIWSGTNTVSYSDYFPIDITEQSAGFGVLFADLAATIHVKSDVATTLSAPSGFSMTVNTFSAPVAPTTANYSTTQPDISRPTISGSPTNTGSGNYNTSDMVDYIVRAGYDDGMGNITWGVAENQITGISDPSSFDISVGLGSSGSENFTPNVWSISRQVNSGGYNDYQRFTSSSFTDNNSGWTGGSDTFTTYADDFLANGQTYYNYFYGTKTSPISTTIFSSGYSSNYSDANDLSAYKLQVYLSGGSYDVGYTMDWNATGYMNAMTDSSYTTITPASIASGSATVSPSAYGYFSDGTRSTNWDYYNYSSTLGIYSSSSYQQTWTDPSDSQYYYFTLNGFTEANGKLVKNDGTAKFVTNADNFYDDAVTTFPASTTVTPTSTYKAAGLFESHGSSTADKANVILRSIDGSYSRFDFESNAGIRLGYIERTSSQLRISSTDIGVLSYSTSDRIKWDSTGVSFFGVSTVAQQASSTDLGTALANLGLRGAGDNYSISTTAAVSTGALTSTQASLGSAVQNLKSSSTSDDPTEIVYQNRGTTTNNTQTTLHTFTVPSSTTYTIEANVVARRTGGSSGTAEDGAGYKFIGTYKNVSGTATIIGAITSVHSAESQAGWDATFTLSGATVRCSVTGATNNNVTWHMTARVRQVGT